MRDAIVARDLGKRYHRYLGDHPTTLKESLLRGLRRRRPADSFWALRDLGFSVAPGRMVGVIGQNGAGKSTLLQLIGGVARADEGSVAVHGRIGALLDLGAGSHPDLTGRENIFINGVIAGLTRREVARRLDSIVAFAELEAFVDSPLRTYSSGMQMRLAFAVAAHTEPEILLIDEVLAVGDLAFQRKCLERIARFKADGCTIVLVSHDPDQIRELCDEALWLRRGRMAAYGAADPVVGEYVAEMANETRRRTPTDRPILHTASGTELRLNENRFGSLEVEIVGVRLFDPAGGLVAEVRSGDQLRVEIEWLAPRPTPAPIFDVTISREDGLVCYQAMTDGVDPGLPPLSGRGVIALEIERLDLAGGQYYVDVGVYEPSWAYAYDYHWHAYPLLVSPSVTGRGILNPPHRWRIARLQEAEASLSTRQAARRR